MAEYSPLNGSRRDESLTMLTEKSVRHGFISKVYGILCSQLAFTTVIAGLVMHYGEPLKRSNPGLVMGLMFGSMAMTLGMMCIFMCQPGLMKVSPTNYILLFLFTLAKSVLVGFISMQYTQQSVLLVTAITAFVVLGLTMFACQTKYDFTGFGPYLMCALLVLMGMSFCFMLGSMMGLGSSPAFQALHLAYAALGALIFSFYIVYDTQLIVGGKHERQFGIDDYCMAAISLYMDIIQLFLFLLQLFGERK